MSHQHFALREVCARCSYPNSDAAHFSVGPLRYCRSLPGQQLYSPLLLPVFGRPLLRLTVHRFGSLVRSWLTRPDELRVE